MKTGAKAKNKSAKRKKLNVLAEAALVVRIPTGDPCDNVEDVLIEDIIDNPKRLSEISESINDCAELDAVVSVLVSFGRFIKEKFPKSEILLSRDRHLQEPIKVDLDVIDS